MTMRVGFFGLGKVGKPTADLAKAGFDLLAYVVQSAPLEELRALGANVARSLPTM
jgi:3-hydroxyisobutyrate dehydrogenase-like beta-hydroxyacid dehydrogenase